MAEHRVLAAFPDGLLHQYAGHIMVKVICGLVAATLSHVCIIVAGLLVCTGSAKSEDDFPVVPLEGILTIIIDRAMHFVAIPILVLLSLIHISEPTRPKR